MDSYIDFDVLDCTPCKRRRLSSSEPASASAEKKVKPAAAAAAPVLCDRVKTHDLTVKRQGEAKVVYKGM